MRAEIITIGDELCRGEIINTNATSLASMLWDLQITVTHLHSCRDLPEDIDAVVRLAASRSDLLLLSGGLGPTLDDLTVDTVSNLLQVSPVVHRPSELLMKKRFKGESSDLGGSASRQVRVPDGAIAYVNSAGLAPAFEVKIGRATLMALPGPPSEVQAIVCDHLRERIATLRLQQGESVEHVARRIYRVFGAGEGGIATALEGLTLGSGASLHYQVCFPETLVKFVVRSQSENTAAQHLRDLDIEVRQRLGPLIYGIDNDSMPAAVLRLLQEHHHSIATAESCTGGRLAGLLTDIPGVSQNFPGGVVTYSNAEKIRQIGVSEHSLHAHGAVSEVVVEEMAKGVRERIGTDWGLAVSGIAGPEGGTTEKPVGTVCVAAVGPDDACQTRTYHWPGTREQVRALSAYWALNLVRQSLVQF